jgi:riboflavin synthase
MFTGIIERTCSVQEILDLEGRRRLILDLSPLRDSSTEGPLTALGDSIAVDGVCLTVSALEDDRASFDVIPETLEKTTLGALNVGHAANVERALRFGDRVDGHLVQGHVEGTGRVDAVDRLPGEVRLGVSCGAEFIGRCLLKGSVTLDGVSLTVAELAPERLVVALVPHTLEITGLGRLAPGDRVNLEADMIGQWVIHTVTTLGVDGVGGQPSAGS